jgi:DNA-directed RNA polymerase subunit RPC12/RpoP
MSDQFICISCWKEFAAREDDLKQHGGKIVCPFCGYVQPAPAKAPGAAEAPIPVVKLEGGEPTGELVSEVPWSSVHAGDDDFPITEDDERTDRVEIPASFIEAASGAGPMGFEEEGADEKTPFEVLLPEGAQGRVAVEPSDGVLVRELRAAEAAGEAIVWQLRTPSGLTFKFTDPEALLGWKKKLSTYKRLDVSPDGERWVDFSRFVREYEELGDPVRAFVLSSRLDDDDLPPPAPVKSLEDLEHEATEENAADRSEKKSGKGKGADSPQFTFKVKEEKTGGWGKYFAFAVLGLGLGAGIVLAVLHFTGIFVLPI